MNLFFLFPTSLPRWSVLCWIAAICSRIRQKQKNQIKSDLFKMKSQWFRCQEGGKQNANLFIFRFIWKEPFFVRLCKSTQRTWLKQQVRHPGGVQNFLQVSAHAHLTCTHTHTHFFGRGLAVRAQARRNRWCVVACWATLGWDADPKRRRLLLWHERRGVKLSTASAGAVETAGFVFPPAQVERRSEFLSRRPRNHWVTAVAPQPRQPLQMHWDQFERFGCKMQLLGDQTRTQQHMPVHHKCHVNL